MDKKINIRKISDFWGEYDCSSNRNLPKLFKWVPKDTKESYEHTIYVDHYIGSVGFNDGSKEKLCWLLESPQMNE